MATRLLNAERNGGSKKIATDAEGRSLKCRRRDGQKITGRIKRCRVQVALPTDGNAARLLIL
jgi:hypothetical protein